MTTEAMPFVRKSVSLAVLVWMATYPQPAQSKDIKLLDSLRTSATLLAKSSQSCATDHDCQTIALGSRACGGPSSYLIIGSATKYQHLVRMLAKEIKALERQANRDTFSTCVALQPPKVRCQEHKCLRIGDTSEPAR